MELIAWNLRSWLVRCWTKSHWCSSHDGILKWISRYPFKYSIFHLVLKVLALTLNNYLTVIVNPWIYLAWQSRTAVILFEIALWLSSSLDDLGTFYKTRSVICRRTNDIKHITTCTCIYKQKRGCVLNCSQFTKGYNSNWIKCYFTESSY